MSLLAAHNCLAPTSSEFAAERELDSRASASSLSGRESRLELMENG